MMMRHNNINTTSEDMGVSDYDSRPSNRREDSPDFNRRVNNTEDNDDLTVSHTLVTNNNTTYRGIMDTQNTRR